MTRQNLFVLFQPYIWYVHHRRLLGLVEHLCVYLSRGKLTVAQKLRDGVDIGTNIQHHDGEGMPGTMEGYLLGDASPEHPHLYCMVGGRCREEIVKHQVRWVPALTQQLSGLRRDVDVLLSAGFLLLEDDSRVLSLRVYFAPCHLHDV